MDSINNIINWLFNDRTGVFVLLGSGVLLFLLIAWLLEKRMRKQFYNHKKTADDWDLFDTEDDE
ncbi:MAG: hypothetical protein J6S63_12210 [Atopobiaceae bacterium]|nr:hypothetical protein [Atopobiaceae bacterium]